MRRGLSLSNAAEPATSIGEHKPLLTFPTFSMKPVPYKQVPLNRSRSRLPPRWARFDIHAGAPQRRSYNETAGPTCDRTGATLLVDLARALVEVECPGCGYPFEIQMLDASCQVHRRCPCCRVRIHLVEPDGTVSGGIEDVESAFRDLERALRRLQ